MDGREEKERNSRDCQVHLWRDTETAYISNRHRLFDIYSIPQSDHAVVKTRAKEKQTNGPTSTIEAPVERTLTLNLEAEIGGLKRSPAVWH
jgi:hypothetical protein